MTQSSTKKVLLIILLVVGLVIGAISVIGVLGFGFLFATKPVMVTSPVPAGQVEIHVEFESVPTPKYNEMNRFISSLAQKHKVPTGPASSSSYHGTFGSGTIHERYVPTHEIPDAEVEAKMQEEFTAFLKASGLDEKDASLELRYGPVPESETTDPDE